MTNTTAQQQGQQIANKANKSCYSTTANVNCKLRPGPSDNASSSWTDSAAALHFLDANLVPGVRLPNKIKS